jgi:hypothetical protein
VAVGAWDDEDDWVGEPPEGRYTRDRAKPDFWRHNRQLSITAAGIGLALLILLVVLLL